MKLAQAEKSVGALLKRLTNTTQSGGSAVITLTAEDQVAITVLWKFAGRLLEAKSSVRALLLAILGKDELNQETLFEEGT